MTWLFHLAPYFAGAAALLGVILKLFGVLGQTVRFFTAFLPSPRRSRHEREQLRADVSRILREVTPNGGGSMKDAVNAILAEQRIGTQRHRAILSDADSGWFEADTRGNTTWANRTYCRMVGRQLEELTGRGWEGTIDPDERGDVVTEWDRCMQVGTEFTREVTYLRPDGAQTRCRVHSYVLRDAAGKAIGHYGWIRTVGQREDARLRRTVKAE